MRLTHLLQLLLAIVVLTTGLGAQSAPPTDFIAHPDWPEAKPADVASPTSTVQAFYDAISGPIGQKRNWARVRSLFIPSGRVAFVIPARASGMADIQLLNLDEYQRLVDVDFVRYGFYDRNIANRVERFGFMADVYSTYESRSTPNGKPFARGIKSIQLLERNQRWYIVQIYWDTERPGLTLPEEYLHNRP